MKQFLQYFSHFKNISFIVLLCICGHSIMAQGIYLDSDAEFYLSKDIVFTTSSTVVNMDPTATFSMEAGTSWGSDQEYVDGKVTVYGKGITKIPSGNNGVFAPVNMDHEGSASVRYINAAPAAGSNGVDVDAVGSTEYWEMTGNAVVSLPWNENSGITDLVNNTGGSFSSIAIVGLSGGVWDLVSASHSFTVTGDLLNGDVTSDIDNPLNLEGFSQFTFGIDHQVVLDVDDYFLETGIRLLSNPVRVGENDIRFSVSGDVIDLKASIYDIHGRLIDRFDNIDLSMGVGNIPKSNLKTGLYFVKFQHRGQQAVQKLIIE